MSNNELASRLTALEAEVASLKARLRVVSSRLMVPFAASCALRSAM